MSRYGDVGVLAVELYRSGQSPTPRAAWDAAADQLLATDPLREKNCPRATFLSLCQEGFVAGVPSGSYTKAVENREIAIHSARRLVADPSIAAQGPQHLWALLVPESEPVYNDQMHVVLALWERNLIAIERVTSYREPR